MAREEKEVAGLAPFLITYSPLPGEVPIADCLSLPTDQHVIAPRADLDPWAEAEACKREAEGRPVAILMPGTRFDATGTRIGRGGGWYDQFLALVPHQWMRIGFCFIDEYTSEPIERKAWDQPVDRIGVIDHSTGAIAWHDTHARTESFDTITL